MDKNKNIFRIVVVALIVLVAILQIYMMLQSKTESIVYVDNVRLFNGFNMTKEVGARQDLEMKGRAEQRDSLIRIAQRLDTKDENPAYEQLVVRINGLEREIDQLQQDLGGRLSQDIWTRLNLYIKEFSEKEEYALVVGTQGTGTVMYGSSSLDITEAMLEYANFKYEGN